MTKSVKSQVCHLLNSSRVYLSHYVEPSSLEGRSRLKDAITNIEKAQKLYGCKEYNA